MALSTYLLQKSRDNGAEAINGCYSMLYTVDPALSPSDTAAERLALATAAAGTAMGVTLQSNYFDVTEQLIGAAAGGYLPADDDNVVFTEFQTIITIA